ncbi:phospholipase D-like domain-containing protein [Sphingomonas sp. GCM10030256]|uniref:phospholipase D-like domain-containing protein n=1 Tax=Sphingomonas sp. GCM10030256 TaxID=3273427 RepID=UPI00362290AD
MGLFDLRRNCWRIERADKAAVIIDACDYYRVIRQAMLDARHQVLIIGWDFDPRIKLDRTDEANKDETLGRFLLGLAKAKPHVAIKILKWDFGALKTLFRGSAIWWIIRLALTRSITFKLDGAHPKGCSHHQKIVVIDDCFAVCGGIDMTGDRWDRPAHADHDPDRLRPNGRPYGPWHDATSAVTGPLARALGELARERWKRATGETLQPVTEAPEIWPEGLEAHLIGAEFAIARTRADYRGHGEIRESEALFLDMIAAAQRFIYAESQYFASPRIAAAIRARMMEDDPPEFVLVNPIHADGWLEQVAMDATRVRLGQIIGRSDTHNRFRIFTPKTDGGEDIYVHAKVMVVDDRILRVGSSNMNNRSLGLDSECDVAMEAAGDDEMKVIAGLRTRLMAEHLGVEESAVREQFAATGSLLATIDALGHSGRTLQLLEFEKPSEGQKFIADTELLDPKNPDQMFEGFTRRSLFQGLRARFPRRRRQALSSA